ncbi:hypothetical protein R3P38DRAFT_2809906 [Favolaschia claudopus]|uniref:Uncharacterized protein n=1 Tax=Favolaschia claudopus TaxID=2862362 RepID=A0AAV9ZCK8_9AGAR
MGLATQCDGEGMSQVVQACRARIPESSCTGSSARNASQFAVNSGQGGAAAATGYTIFVVGIGSMFIATATQRRVRLVDLDGDFYRLNGAIGSETTCPVNKTTITEKQ